MKKRLTGMFMALMMALTACGGQSAASSEAVSAPAASEPAQSAVVSEVVEDDYVANVASMKGPTSIGMAQLMTSGTEDFNFEMFTEGSEIVPLVVKGEIDIALVPANLAATLYQKTEGGIQVIGINTLGVLEVVAPAAVEIDSFDDLAGKTIYMTGKGTTPESAVRYLTDKYGMDELTIEFQSEATAVVSALKANPEAIAILPQPFATVAKVQNEGMELKLNLTDAWADISDDGSSMVTGVTVARKAFVEEHPARLAQFMEEAAASVEFVNANVEEAAAMVESLDIVKAAIGKQAIPRCNTVSITGEEMQSQLSGYLDALFAFDPSMVGGQVPDAEFYYIP
jgi:NitT/TauT family transport system substrate-binding protein